MCKQPTGEEIIRIKMMKNIYHLRNTKKSWIVYAIGLFLVCSMCLAFKNFNDKMTMMGDSVHRYQQMIDKQSEQLSDVTKENERYKRDLKHTKELHAGNMKEMEIRLTALQDDCKQETRRLEKELEDSRDSFNTLSEDNRKLENKYKTLSKANNGAISEVENYKQENKKLRAQLHDATTSKSSELLELRDKLDKVTQEREQYKGQYEALFHQHQQSFDNIQILQTERDRLQEQIREIQKLSHGDTRSSLSPVSAAEQVQVQPDSPGSRMSSSTQGAISPINQVVEEPAPVVSSSTSTSSPAVIGGEGAAAPPIADADNHVQAAIDAAQALARYPPVIKPKPAGRRVDQKQYVKPLQPARHDQDDLDVLNAPQNRVKSEYNQVRGQVQQPLQGWYQGGGQQQHYGNVPRVQQYGGQNNIVHHGDHYHLQPQAEQYQQHVQVQAQQPRYKRQKQQYQDSYNDVNSWNGNSYNNDIQEFYRGANFQRDF